MKRLCCNKLFFFIKSILAIYFFIPYNGYSYGPIQSIAFYYSKEPPLEVLSKFHSVVLEPQNINLDELEFLQSKNVDVYAYLSIGEVNNNSVWRNEISNDWILGKNHHWNSVCMDMFNSSWHVYLINNLIKRLSRQGYNGLFLDTMDSFMLFAKSPAFIDKQILGLTKLLKEIRLKYPEFKIIYNRGFEVFEQTDYIPTAIVAESLFKGWDSVNNKYVNVKPLDRNWLIEKLNKIKIQRNITIIIIDYLPPGKKSEAIETANKIKRLGFVPWISTVELNSIEFNSN